MVSRIDHRLASARATLAWTIRAEVRIVIARIPVIGMQAFAYDCIGRSDQRDFAHSHRAPAEPRQPRAPVHDPMSSGTVVANGRSPGIGTARTARQGMLKQMMTYMRRGLWSSTARVAGLATIAMLLVTIADPSPASAGPTNVPSGPASAATASTATTDFSSRRRRGNRGGSAAGLAFMGMAIGTMGAIAAQQQRNDYYNRYDNGPGYGYYGGGPRYYGGGPYYGRRYYRSY